MGSERGFRRWLAEKIAGEPFERPPANPIPGTECSHLWSNWSKPEDVARPFDAISGWGQNCHITQEQHRTCFNCNLTQRSYT